MKSLLQKHRYNLLRVTYVIALGVSAVSLIVALRDITHDLTLTTVVRMAVVVLPIVALQVEAFPTFKMARAMDTAKASRSAATEAHFAVQVSFARWQRELKELNAEAERLAIANPGWASHKGGVVRSVEIGDRMKFLSLHFAEHEVLKSRWEELTSKYVADWGRYESQAAQVPSARVAKWLRNAFTNSLSSRLTDLAVIVAGERRSGVADEWRAHLAGAPEAGVVVGGFGRVVDAAGFVLAALRFRAHDVASPLWRPIDWLLVAKTRTNSAIAVCVGALVIYIQAHDGFHTLVTEGWGWCAGCAGALYMLATWLRGIRGIELASRNGQEPGRP
ncbi:hypothetical protein ACIP9H_40410 [Streptomyces sp. NPDC088732]|uniref:hypothetical protein n=1 Tax=Streptomyces sp. NPDC088732 TaxID=3365879 RepID=UPI00380E2156